MRLKTILTISLGLNLLVSFFLVKEQYLKYYVSLPLVIKKTYHNKNFKIKDYLNRKEVFKILPKDSNSILFLGNSLTQNFDLAKYFQDINIKNKGVSGDLIVNVIDRLTPIIQNNPKKIFVEIGINDLGRGIAKDSVITNYKKLLDKLQKECKSAKIYIQSLFPVENSRTENPRYCNSKINANIKLINKELLKYGKKQNIVFIDTYSMFVLNGQLNPKYSLDGIHLSSEGYLLWSKILRPYLEK